MQSFQMLSVMCKCAGVANGCYRLLLLCTAVCGTSAESVPQHRGSNFTRMKHMQVGIFGIREKKKPKKNGLTQTP